MRVPLISVVIPCYRSAATVGDVVAELCETFQTRPDEFDHEIILVNDGSPDDTLSVIQTIADENDAVTAVDLSRNFGQHAAIMAGFGQVQGDVVVCMDDDGQTPADQIFRLVDKVMEGTDIAFASYKHKQHSAFRNQGSRFNGWCEFHFMGIPRDLQVTSYFACKRFVVQNALTYTNPYPFVEGLLFQCVKTYANVPVDHRKRVQGESGYSLSKLLRLWANGFTAFSVLPLRVATVIGFIISLIGFICIIAIVMQKLFVPDVDAGWTSLMACLLAIGGLLMLMLGLMGEYIGRIYISLNNRPQYVIRSITSHGAKEYVHGGAFAQENAAHTASPHRNIDA